MTGIEVEIVTRISTFFAPSRRENLRRNAVLDLIFIKCPLNVGYLMNVPLKAGCQYAFQPIIIERLPVAARREVARSSNEDTAAQFDREMQ